MSADHIPQLRDSIRQQALSCGRNPDNISIVAASKTRTAGEITAACRQGISIFGENYVQEWQQKALLVNVPVKWHFIGKIQTNKLKYIVGKVDLIHSLASVKAAQAIQKLAHARNIQQAVLVQVNLSHEVSKDGIAPEALNDFLHQLQACEHLDVQGLMTFPPPSQKAEDNRKFFKQLREIAHKYIGMKSQLSMGTTDDYTVAIEEGATLLRLGRVLFKGS